VPGVQVAEPRAELGAENGLQRSLGRPMSTTSAPWLRAAAAISQPIQPAPTITTVP
jgi:hypothetical protein